MKTYDEAFATATEGSPFSNGFEGEMWMSAWCELCAEDVVDGGCPLIGVGMLGFTPTEWREDNPGGLRDRYVCTEFTAELGEAP